MLYIFGDSYTTMVNRPDWTYLSLIKQALDTDEQNFGLVGSSLDYTFSKFEEQRNNFVQGDVILITLTVEEKVTFWPDRPTLSHAVMSRKFFDSVEHTKEEKKAMQDYYRYLHNPDSIRIQTLNFLHNVDAVSREKNLRTVVINSIAHSFDHAVTSERFPNLHIARGCLADPTKAEINDKDLFGYFEFHMYVNDPRPFHFSEPNHRILADSIMSALEHNTEIDLTNIFMPGIFGRGDFNRHHRMLAERSPGGEIGKHTTLRS